MGEFGIDLLYLVAQIVAVDRDVELRDLLAERRGEARDQSNILGRTGKHGDADIFLPALIFEPALVGLARANRCGPVGANDFRLAGPERRVSLDETAQIIADRHGRFLPSEMIFRSFSGV